MFLPLRVGDSFIADDNRFAQATLYATDMGADVVQEALGTLNNSSLALQAVQYAYRHGVTVIASAADEAAQHNNWPSSLPHVILVNSVTPGLVPPPDQSYLSFNGCTNFNAKITLAIPSTSCSSNATGLAAGMAGLIYSAARDAKAAGALESHPDTAHCKRTNGTRCVITPNEVRQLMATGAIDDTPQADDVNFADRPPAEPSCSPVPAPGCTDPGGPGNALQAQVDANRQVPIGPPGLFESYPARWGPDQFYGYGRVNMRRALKAILAGHGANPPASKILPEAELTSPQWYEQVNPSKATLDVEGQVFARGSTYTCSVLVAPGQYPNNRRTSDSPPGDFAPLDNRWCDGHTRHSANHSGVLAQISISQLKSRFPPGTTFNGPEPQASPANDNGRPNAAPHSFTIRLDRPRDPRRPQPERQGPARRLPGARPGHAARLPQGDHRGAITAGTPTSDGESSPALADLNGDNRNELIVAGSDGFVHALRPDGTELPGWPVRGDRPPLHTGERAFTSGEVSSDVGGADSGLRRGRGREPQRGPRGLRRRSRGQGLRMDATSASASSRSRPTPSFSGKPLQPFVNSRHGEANRTQHGFLASPVLADIGGDDRLEIVAAGMDRHLYAWHRTAVRWPASRCSSSTRARCSPSIPQTHQVTFRRAPAPTSRARSSIRPRGRADRRRRSRDRPRDERGVRRRPGRRLERGAREQRLVHAPRPARAGDRRVQVGVRRGLRRHPGPAAETCQLARLRDPPRRQRAPER